MKRGATGQWRTISTVGEECKAFIPSPLPPTPPFRLEGVLQELHDHALVALGRLDSLTNLLPDTHLFLYMYVRKEAVLSSQIEGTQSSLSDLLLFENEETPGVPLDDVQEVSNYVAAMTYGLQRIKEGFPLSLRLLKEIHEVLLSKGRGERKQPGQFRSSQNWIGGSRPGTAVYVPPPADELMSCMGALEMFLHDKPERTPILIKAGLAHAQFESIHPFLDGNGRLGRLLITLLLCSDQILGDPLLYLSLYLKNQRAEYYDLLQKVRFEGMWEDWMQFFLQGVQDTAQQCVDTAQRLLKLFDTDRDRIQALGKAAGSVLRVHHALIKQPISSIKQVEHETGLTFPTVSKGMEHLVRMGMVKEISRRKRARWFFYVSYLDVLNEGTEPFNAGI